MAEKRTSGYDFQAEVFKNRWSSPSPPLLHNDKAGLSPRVTAGKESLLFLQVMSCKREMTTIMSSHTDLSLYWSPQCDLAIFPSSPLSVTATVLCGKHGAWLLA